MIGVGARAAVHPVVAATRINGVVARAGLDDVARNVSVDDVVTVIAKHVDRIGAGDNQIINESGNT